jgi:hypothetical protein
MTATMYRVHAHIELDRALAQEIAKSPDPWRYVRKNLSKFP